MKQKKRITVMFAVALLTALLLGSACAGGVTARITDDVLLVTWSGGSPSNTLEVYHDGWPVAFSQVSGVNGTARVPLTNPNGRYTVRLRTAGGCMTADVSGESTSATPMPTAKPQPTAKPTPAPNRQNVAARSDLSAEVVAQVNAERARYGLSQLRVDAELTRAAAVRAEEIVRKFSHTRPDGTAWSTVSASAYGENIARGQKTADKVMAAWLTSEGHRANILRASYGSIGVCAIVVDGVTYWVQLFGR